MKVLGAILFALLVIVAAVLFSVAILFPDIMKNEDKYLNNK